jgi:hypothetical protein
MLVRSTLVEELFGAAKNAHQATIEEHGRDVGQRIPEQEVSFRIGCKWCARASAEAWHRQRVQKASHQEAVIQTPLICRSQNTADDSPIIVNQATDIDGSEGTKTTTTLARRRRRPTTTVLSPRTCPHPLRIHVLTVVYKSADAALCDEGAVHADVRLAHAELQAGRAPDSTSMCPTRCRRSIGVAVAHAELQDGRALRSVCVRFGVGVLLVLLLVMQYVLACVQCNIYNAN